MIPMMECESPALTFYPELQFLPSDDMNLILHPDSVTVLQVNKATFEVLRAYTQGQTIDEITGRYHCKAEEIVTLLRKVKELVEAEERKGTLFDPGISPAITRLTLLVSNACNLRCKYCYARGGIYSQKPQLMSREIAVRAVKLAAEHGTLNTMVFLGGEPALNIAAIEAACGQLEKMKKGGCLDRLPVVGMVTNGTLITDRLVELINRFKIQVTVSLDGPSEVNDLHRTFKNGGGTFSLIEKNICRLRQATNGREPWGFEVVYTTRHLEQGLTFAELVRFFVSKFGIMPIIRVVSLPRDTTLDLVPDDNDLVPNFDMLAAYIIESWTGDHPLSLPIEFGSQKALIEKTNLMPYLCDVGVTMLAVDARGDIYPCHALAHKDLKMGSVAAPDVFQSEPFLRVREAFLTNNKQNNQACRACWMRAFCRGCYAQVYNYSHSITQMSEAICQTKRRIAERLIARLARLRADPDRWQKTIENLQNLGLGRAQTCA